MAFIRIGASVTDNDQKKLNDLRKQNKRKRKVASAIQLSLFLISGVLFIILLVFLFDYILTNIFALDSFLSRIDTNSFMQVQATVVTLSIAVVSLITELIQKRVCGIFISKYVMFTKGNIRSNFNLIRISFILVIANCILVLFNFKFTSIFIVLISIVMILMIIENTLQIFKNPNILDQEIEGFFLERIKLNCQKVNQIKEYDESVWIDLLLEENPSIIKPHQEVDQLLSDWYHNIITKSNEKSFNDYAPSVDVIYKVYYSLDLLNANIITYYSLDLFSQYRNQVYSILIDSQQYDLVFKSIDLTSGFIDNFYFNDNEEKSNLSKLAYYFDCFYYINRLASDLETSYRLKRNYIYNLMSCIMNYSRHISISIYARINESEILPDNIRILLPTLFRTLFMSVYKNRLFSHDEKHDVYDIYRSYLAYREGKEFKKTDYVINGWQSFLNYHLHCHANCIDLYVFVPERIIKFNLEQDKILADMDVLFVDLLNLVDK